MGDKVTESHERSTTRTGGATDLPLEEPPTPTITDAGDIDTIKLHFIVSMLEIPLRQVSPRDYCCCRLNLPN